MIHDDDKAPRNTFKISNPSSVAPSNQVYRRPRSICSPPTECDSQLTVIPAISSGQTRYRVLGSCSLALSIRNRACSQYRPATTQSKSEALTAFIPYSNHSGARQAAPSSCTTWVIILTRATCTMTLRRHARQALIATSSKPFIDSRRDSSTPTDRCPLAYTRPTIMLQATSRTGTIESMRRCRLATTATTCPLLKPGMPVDSVEQILWGPWAPLVA